MPDWREKERKRDKKLRRLILQELERSLPSPMGGRHGDSLVEAIVAEPGQGFEGVDHAITLLRNLVAKGYVKITDQRSRTSEMFGLKKMFVEILPAGSSLLNETAGPDADVEDERNIEK